MTIINLRRLTHLYLYHNKFKELPEIIGNLTNLTYLRLSYNKLTELPETISNLTNLINLELNSNKLKELPESIGNLINLTHLELSYNHLTKIPETIGNLTNLTCLDLSINRLSELPDIIGNLTNLTHLDISYNGLSELPLSIINLRRLTEFVYSDNEFDIFPPQIQRFINNVDNNISNLQVYNDGQNVHNQTIQLSLKCSLEKITTQKFNINAETIQAEIANDDVLTRETKQLINQFCNNTEIHSLLLLSFQDVLEYVWETIKRFDKDKQKEIKHIMNQEMNDSVGMCFTGRVSRLINCLNGFSDLVTIEISDNEQINNIILLTKQRLGGHYTTDKHKELVENELRERGYSAELITEWLGFIEEG
jgi:hypothetical protein